MEDRNIQNYTVQQLNDLENELKRIRCMINYYILNESSQFGIRSTRSDHLVDMNLLTHKSSPFTKRDYQRFESLIEKVKNESFLSGSNFLEESSLSIINTSNMNSNHWFACSNDHVYHTNSVREIEKSRSTTHLFFQMQISTQGHKCPTCFSKLRSTMNKTDHRPSSDSHLID